MLLHIVMLAAAAATAVSAATPPGFRPAIDAALVVDYNSTLINGQVVSMSLVQTQPVIGTTRRLTGSSYAVIMLDLDVPTNGTGQTSTLLHWMQTGLTPASKRSTLVGSRSQQHQQKRHQQQKTVYLLQNGTGLAPAAAYIGPSPPARVPLSHRYTQLLVDTSTSTSTSSQTDASLSVLTSAAASRLGFDVQQVLQSAGLLDRVVAANFFNVTNAGPVSSSVSSVSNNSAGIRNSTGASTTIVDTSSSSSPVTAVASRMEASKIASMVGLVLLVFLL